MESQSNLLPLLWAQAVNSDLPTLKWGKVSVSQTALKYMTPQEICIFKIIIVTHECERMQKPWFFILKHLATL